MKQPREFALSFLFASLAFSQTAAPLQAGILYDTPDSLYQQNFDSLASSGIMITFTNDSTLRGWSAFTGTGAAMTSYIASNGTSFGNLMSLGATSATERALGSCNGLSTSVNFAVAFTNQSTTSLDTFTVTYDGEQWRKGSNVTPQSLVFSYGLGTSYAGVSTWVESNDLKFTSPIANASAAAALNGNAAANRVANISSTISGFDWQTGNTLWLRWTDVPDAGEDHALAIDNFRFTATSTITAVPEPSSMALFGIAGLGGVLWRKRRRMKTNAS